MKTLGNELRDVLSRRVANAGSREILQIASALCNDGPVEVTFNRCDVAAPPRFDVDSDVIVDSRTGLMWSRDDVPGGTINWAKAKEACTKLSLGGYSDWRLPTVRELLTIVDYNRHDPAIDTDVFKCQSACYWSSTPLKSSPGDCAWYVHFNGGISGWLNQTGDFQVRAVRASQSFDLWHAR
jgi:hypothetical protein